MRYYPLGRFQGTLLGTVVGGFLGNESQQNFRENYVEENQSTAGTCLGTQKNAQRFDFRCMELTIFCAENLLKYQGWHLGKWLNDWEKLHQNNGDIITKIKGDRLVLMSIPLAIFYHDNLTKLRQIYQELAVISLEENLGIETMQVIGYAIAMALREELDPQTLIDQTIDYLNPNLIVEQQLKLIDQLVKNKTALATATNQILKHNLTLERQKYSSSPDPDSRSSIPLSLEITLALYCFLSTPTDWDLAVLRALRMGQEPTFTGALVGALAGAHNSMSSIPIKHRINPLPYPRLPPQSDNSQEIQQLGSDLFALWSGINIPKSW